MTKPFHTRTFKSGNSVAVRLPKDFAIPEGVEVELAKNGAAVTIKLTQDGAAEKARMLKWLEELKALPKPPEIQKRERIVFPKRPGL
ncbi:MAG: AbrB/MazE/SpoVT family DNA-binding domain-containing protein [Qipengyuania sp.]|jgi:antitoxin VapB|nr:AbrB/MazE/SpoVT family DNA-binding domain-containing protein [Qipengyuania sp.]